MTSDGRKEKNKTKNPAVEEWEGFDLNPIFLSSKLENFGQII